VPAALSSKADSPVEQIIRIMISNTEKHLSRYDLEKKRNSNDHQNVYTLATQHRQLLKGIIHNERTFAMLCVERGYNDVLARLIDEDYPVDLTTACYLIGPHECQTTVLHELFAQVSTLRRFREHFPQDYIERITALTKLIINKYPGLLDTPVNRARTVRQEVEFSWSDCNLRNLIPPRDLT
jgi:hypothetical protein